MDKPMDSKTAFNVLKNIATEYEQQMTPNDTTLFGQALSHIEADLASKAGSAEMWENEAKDRAKAVAVTKEKYLDIEGRYADEAKRRGDIEREAGRLKDELDQVYQIENEQNRMIAEQKEAISRLQQANQRILDQHNKAVAENKRLNEASDNHGKVVAELQQNAERAIKNARECAETCLALRKRNGKLAKKLERLRV